jgi:hypothetical protein
MFCQACVGFLGKFGGAIGWACEMPTLAVSLLALIIALERQDWNSTLQYPSVLFSVCLARILWQTQ